MKSRMEELLIHESIKSELNISFAFCRVPCFQSHLNENYGQSMIIKTVAHVSFLMRKFLFSILSIGPVPAHIAFIMDGNRRYAKRLALYQDGTKPDIAHRVGFNSLIATIQCCFEMGVKQVTVYAFSIDNFKRGPQHVQMLMDLMKEKIDKLMTEECLLKKFEVKIIFWGNLELLIEPIRVAAKKVMDMTVHNNGHQIGLKSLVSIIQYCFEIGVKCVTLYAFSIDNFKRRPEEVQLLMDLMKTKLDELMMEQSLLMEFDVRVNFWGNLELLTEPVRLAAKKVIDMTVHNKGPVLSVCVAYTSTNEITHAIEASVRGRGENVEIYASDLERNMYSADCVEPDIIIRTSGETRLSNFLLWQSEFTHLQSLSALWPEFSLRHFVFSLLEYQKVHGFLKRLKGETDKNK